MEGVHTIDFKYLSGSFDIGGKDNEYTGSLPAKNGTTGIFADIFRYRYKLKTEEYDDGSGKTKKRITAITASYWFGCYAYAATDKSIITEKDFSADEDGAKAASAWLQAEYDNA